ncbi:Hypothetical protein PHPALM_37357 [Phytophthora palmivora]|uniref:Uncharacterized protein n=1 Tax=Phytophthora palmivora TaxID=4796 RepID=A0A2P4WXN0_9STRA|nr:Hypothetical protein PHPALM_37357 [Phytophthora palmivora]
MTTTSDITASADASSGPSAPPTGYTSAEGDTGGDGSPENGSSFDLGTMSMVASSGTTTGASANVKNSGNAVNASSLSPADAAAHGISTTMAPGSGPSVPSYLEALPVHDGDINIHLIGVPATVRHLEGGAFTRDGYGGLEVLVPVESLTTRKKSALNDLRTRILVPRGAPLEIFGTISSLRKVIQRDIRAQALLQGGDTALQDIDQVQAELAQLKRDYQLVTSHWDQRLFQAGVEKEALQNARDDIRHLMEEHNRDNRGLRKQVKNLSVQLEDAKIHIRLLEERFRASGFSPIDLMNFLGGGRGGSVINAHWQRLLDRLVHFKDGSAVDPAWRTMITVIAADDPGLVSTPFVSLSCPRDSDGGGSTQAEPPRYLDLTRTHTSVPANTSSSKRKWSSGIEHSSHDCRTDKYPSIQAKQQALTFLTDYPVTWDDLRLDLQALMLSGVQYPDAVEWLSDDREAHVTFRLGALIEMLVRMMYWNSLDDVYWTKYVPRRYFTMAEGVLDGLQDQGVEPEYWGPLVEGLDDDPDPNALVVEADVDEWVDENFVPEAEGDDGQGPESSRQPNPENVPPKSKRRRTNCDSLKSTSRKDRSGQGSTTNLTKKAFSELTSDDLRIVETPGENTGSWMHYGVRMKNVTSSEQTFGFPDYTPNRYDLDLLKERTTSKERELIALLGSKPWDKIYAFRPRELFFHKRKDLSADALIALDSWIGFVSRKTRAFWEETHWLTFDTSDNVSPKLAAIYLDRSKRHASFRKKALSLLRKVTLKLPDTIWNEPGIWKYPSRICHWVLMDPSHCDPETSKLYTLLEQLAILDVAEPARTLWSSCSTNAERIAHLPKQVRKSLIPVDKHTQIRDLWRYSR